MSLKYLILSLLLVQVFTVKSQVYVDKKTRHRFAQLNLGVDFQSHHGGHSYTTGNSSLEKLPFETKITPRFVIGGTHFWGHADLYLAIPLHRSSYSIGDQEVYSGNGVETVVKYYPWAIKHQKLRPFVGLSLTLVKHRQIDKSIPHGKGPLLSKSAVPIYTGFTFNHKNQLFELGLMWNYSNKHSYYVSNQQSVTIRTPPIHLNFSYRFMLETTLSAEKNWESGKTKKITEHLASKKKLNGIYFGVGLSSSFWSDEHEHNQINHPFMEKNDNSVSLDLSLGYYLHNPDLTFSIAYRKFGSETNAYGIQQNITRTSLGFEIVKFIADYHGFVPFIGPIVSLEKLQFKEFSGGTSVLDETSDQLGYGLTFGWDIRPNRIQSWLLRTNLRWYPSINLTLSNGTNISFDTVEFNFIQLVVYPNRMFGKL